MQQGEIHYARAGEHHIAWREYVGEAPGDHEIVMVSGANFPMDSFIEDPIARRLLEGLAGHGRLITFDRRGIALSDQVTDWEAPLYEQWADDLAAVIEAAGCERPTVFSWALAPVARCCSVRHPGLIGRLVLYNPTSPLTEADSGWLAAYIGAQQRIMAGEALQEGDQANPYRDADPAFKRWNDEAGRLGASPRQASRLLEKILVDPAFDSSQVVVPTLVIVRAPEASHVPREYLGRAAAEIPGAELADLGEGDSLAVGAEPDRILAEVSRYLTGRVRLPAPERQLVAVLFTDLVDSTRTAVEAGDERWKALLDRHDEVTRYEVERNGGEVVKMTGDGVLALLPSGTAALAAGCAIRDHLRDAELEVRAGIHVGEIDRRGDDVSGLAVNIAARVMGHAGAGQIVATAVAAEVIGRDAFASAGEAHLKGIEGSWELYRADQP